MNVVYTVRRVGHASPMANPATYSSSSSRSFSLLLLSLDSLLFAPIHRRWFDLMVCRAGHEAFTVNPTDVLFLFSLDPFSSLALDLLAHDDHC